MKIIDSNNLNEVIRQIKLIKKNEIIIIAKNEEFNRKILENKNVDCLIFKEFPRLKNNLKQRDSGLNHVLCKLAYENEIKIGFDFSSFFKLNDFEKVDFLSKLMQNIKLCKKYKLNVLILNIFKMDKKDLNGFLLTLGMTTLMAKKAVENSFNFNNKF